MVEHQYLFQLEKLPLTATNVAKATKDDEILSQVHFIQQGWRKGKTLLEKPLRPYFVRRLQLTVQSGCILNGLQVVIPSSKSSMGTAKGFMDS